MIRKGEPAGLDSTTLLDANTWVTPLAIAACIAAFAACEDVRPPDFGGGSVATWTSYGAMPGGTHYSSATQITPANVRWLEPAWEHRS